MTGSVLRFIGALLGGVGALVLPVCLLIAILGGWLTHLVICFKAGMWGFLVAGAIFFPIGIVHGVGRWFGAW
jgi:hypothetical protein